MVNQSDTLRVFVTFNLMAVTQVVHPDPVDIWRARVMVSNSLQDRDIFKDAHAPVFLFSDGSTRWYPGGIFFTSCVMTVTVFPFDSHDCSLSFISIGFYAEELVFEPVNPEANLRGYSHNGEWELTSTSVSPLQIPVADETFSGFKVTLRLTRRPWFFLLNVVMPIMLLSLLNFMVFVLPNDCGEKVTFGTTILLSQVHELKLSD
nr:hypothetical protein BaRGS_000094 [Batillaria attramentaria]